MSGLHLCISTIFICFSSFPIFAIPMIRPMAHVQQYDYHQPSKQEETERYRIWEEYWSDWINIGVTHMNDSYIDFIPDTSFDEERFLSVLHRSFKHEEQKCIDKNRNDCNDWANMGYCTHFKSRYRSWMSENCPESCSICTRNPSFITNGETCRNKRGSCDMLFRFCNGPFGSHMREWCPRTCRLCAVSSETTTTIATQLTSLSPSVTITTDSLLPNRIGELARNGETCFPQTCGLVPVLQGRRRGKRAIPLEDVLGLMPNTSLKIVGGARAIKGEWPWHGLLIQQIDEHARFCGVTIICRHWLVTAAHCIVSREQGFTLSNKIMETFSLYVGRHQGLFGHSEESTQVFGKKEIERFIIHNRFEAAPSFSYDIALIKLRRTSPIQFNRFVQPVCLPTARNIVPGDILTTYGWGSTMGHGPSAQYLKEIQLPFVDYRKCRLSVWGLRKQGTICAGGGRNRDACSGDSGGSLVMRKAGNGTRNMPFVFYGITSYGSSYCNSRSPYRPGVYTDVAHYRQWIELHTNGCCDDNAPTSTPQPAQTPLRRGRVNSSSGSKLHGDFPFSSRLKT